MNVLDSLSRRADELWAAGRHQEAAAAAQEALAVDPRHAPALYVLGSSLLRLGRTQEAIERLQACAEIARNNPVLYNNLGLALAGAGRLEDAVRAYDRALALSPGYARALSNRALALVQRYEYARALEDANAALAVEPRYGAALVNRGLALAGLGRGPEALQSYLQALPAPQALANASSLLSEAGRGAEALDCARQLVRVAPDLEEALGVYHTISQQQAVWDDYEQRVQHIVAQLRAGRRPVHPWYFLSVADSPSDQRLAAAAFARTLADAAPLWRGERYRHERVRVAYLSADFGDHATSYLAAGLFEHHDRARFELYAISHGTITQGPMRGRLLQAFEHFEDVAELDVRRIAARVRELEIDILVDLKGYTHGNRVEVLAHRPAPTQVHYLGYPGTLAARWVDYLIADATCVPEAEYAHYAEQIVTLPGSYQANDDRRVIEHKPQDRAEWGLPERGLVLCAFHQTYKLNPPIFDAWMRILRRLDGACLWLLAGDPASQARLRAEATRRGVDPKRLVFAPRIPAARHLARHGLADIYLDAWPVSAHTTASDALWSGVPVIAIEGRSFAARVSSSVLRAAGLDDCIAHDLSEYENLVVALCTDSERLAALRRRVEEEVPRSPLYDTSRFTRALEHAYNVMYERQQAGLDPGPIVVPPIG